MLIIMLKINTQEMYLLLFIQIHYTFMHLRELFVICFEIICI